MSIVPSIPMEPESWCKNPSGYVRHQLLLSELATYLESENIELTLPPPRPGWDLGVDLLLGKVAIDLKSFSLRAGPKSYTWDSEYWDGKPAPKYVGLKTDYFIHPFGDSILEWKVCKERGLRSSFYGGPPFYYRNDVEALSSFIETIK